MSLYKIADLVVELNCYQTTLDNAKKYIIKDADEYLKPDIVITTDLVKLKKLPTRGNYTDDVATYLFEGIEFARQLLKFNGVWIHASAVVVDGDAYLFSAPCGTGKSTHTSKWLELFGDKAFIINDDKPAVRIIDDEYWVYGTPWSGKHDISVNTKAKLKGICFLHRAETNSIKFMDKASAVKEILDTSHFRTTAEQMMKKLEILDKIVRNVPIYEMGCTPTIEAAKMAYEFMSTEGGKNNEN